jgi:hypothetical protein
MANFIINDFEGLFILLKICLNISIDKYNVFVSLIWFNKFSNWFKLSIVNFISLIYWVNNSMKIFLENSIQWSIFVGKSFNAHRGICFLTING